MTIDWMAAGGVATVLGVAGTLGGWLVRNVMRDSYVDTHTHQKLEGRVGALEVKTANMATHQDVAAVTTRVSSVEIGIAEMKATLQGVHESGLRTERMVQMLVQNELRLPAGELGQPS